MANVGLSQCDGTIFRLWRKSVKDKFKHKHVVPDRLFGRTGNTATVLDSQSSPSAGSPSFDLLTPLFPMPWGVLEQIGI
jgi:hypothetical protein